MADQDNRQPMPDGIASSQLAKIGKHDAGCHRTAFPEFPSRQCVCLGPLENRPIMDQEHSRLDLEQDRTL